MAIINREVLDGVCAEMNNAFAKGGKAGTPVWAKIATRIPSTKASNIYKWLSGWPKLRQWVGPKVVQNLKGNGYIVENLDFEATVSIPRNDIEDGHTVVYLPMMEQAGQNAQEFPDELVFVAVNNAFTAPCFDGKPFICSDHPVGDRKESNMGTMRLSADSLDAADASIGAARAAMRARKDAEGRSMNVTPTILMVGPMLENVARNLLTLERFKDGTPNPYKGSLELLVCNQIEDPDQWFLLDTSRVVKPFIFQPRKEPEMVPEGVNSPNAFFLAEYLFSIEARGAGAFGFWQLIWGSTGKG